MIIQCRNCNKKFEIPDSAIPNDGRKVQCGNCSTQWIQMPQTENQIKSQEKKVEIFDYKKEINPSESLPIKKKQKIKNKKIENKKYKSRLGFIGYVFIFGIIFISLVGILETFSENISNYWPQINDQLSFIYESVNNIIIIIKELFNNY